MLFFVNTIPQASHSFGSVINPPICCHNRCPGTKFLLSNLISIVFPSIYVVDIPNTFNSIIFATVQSTLQENLRVNLEYLGNQDNVSSLLIDSMRLATENLQPHPPPSIVFTDDKASVEWITNTMIVDFIFSDELEYLQ